MAFILYLLYSRLPWQLHHFYESRHHGQLRHAVAADFDLCVSRFHHYLAVQHDDPPLTWISFHNAIVTNRCLDAPINWWYNNPVSQLQPPFQTRLKRYSLLHTCQPFLLFLLFFPLADLPHLGCSHLGFCFQPQHSHIKIFVLCLRTLASDIPFFPAIPCVIIIALFIDNHNASVRQFAAPVRRRTNNIRSRR